MTLWVHDGLAHNPLGNDIECKWNVIANIGGDIRIKNQLTEWNDMGKSRTGNQYKPQFDRKIRRTTKKEQRAIAAIQTAMDKTYSQVRMS